MYQSECSVVSQCVHFPWYKLLCCFYCLDCIFTMSFFHCSLFYFIIFFCYETREMQYETETMKVIYLLLYIFFSTFLTSFHLTYFIVDKNVCVQNIEEKGKNSRRICRKIYCTNVIMEESWISLKSYDTQRFIHVYIRVPACLQW